MRSPAGETQDVIGDRPLQHCGSHNRISSALVLRVVDNQVGRPFLDPAAKRFLKLLIIGVVADRGSGFTRADDSPDLGQHRFSKFRLVRVVQSGGMTADELAHQEARQQKPDVVGSVARGTETELRQHRVQPVGVFLLGRDRGAGVENFALLIEPRFHKPIPLRVHGTAREDIDSRQFRQLVVVVQPSVCKLHGQWFERRHFPGDECEFRCPAEYPRQFGCLGDGKRMAVAQDDKLTGPSETISTLDQLRGDACEQLRYFRCAGIEFHDGARMFSERSSFGGVNRLQICGVGGLSDFLVNDAKKGDFIHAALCRQVFDEFLSTRAVVGIEGIAAYFGFSAAGDYQTPDAAVLGSDTEANNIQTNQGQYSSLCMRCS